MKIITQNITDLIEDVSKLYQSGNYDAAFQKSLDILKQDKNNLLALTTLGNVEFLKSNYAQALKYYSKIYKKDSSYQLNNLNIANASFEAHDYSNAILFSSKVLDSDSQNLMALSLLGNSYLMTDQYALAKTIFTRALDLSPNDYWLHNSLSQVYQKMHDFDAAANHAWLAVNHSKGEDSQHINFGYLLYEFALEEGPPKVDSLVKKWRDSYPQNRIVKYMSDSLLSSPKVDCADATFVTAIFDNFAEGFDTVLSSLDYRVPEYIGGFLKSFFSQKNTSKPRVLDLGCGTGLCGAYLKKYASKNCLEGVDLSENMLQVAYKKNIYSKLYKSDIFSFLDSKINSYDLMTAGDVFTYIGNLDILFAKIKKSLGKNGKIIFSISKNILNNDDYFLHISGRFVHTFSYLENVLKKHGFHILKSEEKILRSEADYNVLGYIVAAEKI